MSEIVKISEEINPAIQEKAEKYHAEVLARTIVTAGHLLELGRLFKTIRDEKLYKLLDASTFSEYCGFPEIQYARPTIYSFIGIYELYVLKLDLNPRKLIRVGHRALQIIKPVVKELVASDMRIEEWLEKAKVLSEPDLINEVREAQGKPEMLPIPKEQEDVYPFSYSDYIEFVRNCPCLICGEPSEPHHFPKTKGAGAREQDVIPLCRKHHNEADDTWDFLWLNKDKIFKFFYDMFLRAFAFVRLLDK